MLGNIHNSINSITGYDMLIKSSNDNDIDKFNNIDVGGFILNLSPAQYNIYINLPDDAVIYEDDHNIIFKSDINIIMVGKTYENYD